MNDIEYIITSGKSIDIIIVLYNKFLKMTSCGEDISSLNHHEKIFYLVEEFETTYNNGGFEHFYCNSISNYSNQLFDALIEIKASQQAEILKESILLWPQELLFDPEKRSNFLLNEMEIEFANQLLNLDKKMSKQKENLSELLIAYVKTNLEFFID